MTTITDCYLEAQLKRMLISKRGATLWFVVI